MALPIISKSARVVLKQLEVSSAKYFLAQMPFVPRRLVFVACVKNHLDASCKLRKKRRTGRTGAQVIIDALPYSPLAYLGLASCGMHSASS